MLDAWAPCVSGIIPANAWRSALPISISPLPPQPLLSQAWPVQRRAECLLFSSHSALPGSLLKGILAFSSRPGVWFSTAAEAVMADKRQRAPELRRTQHLYLLRHSPLCLWQGRRRRGGENGGQAAAFMCLYVDVSHQGKRWTDSLQWSHQSALLQHTVILTHRHWQRKALLLLLMCFYNPGSVGFVRWSKIVGWWWKMSKKETMWIDMIV